MESILKKCLLFLCIAFLYSEDLSLQYKQIMQNENAKTPNQQNHTLSQDKELAVNYNLVYKIKKIQSLKKDTFESTSDYTNRVNHAISILQNEIKFFAQNGSKEYSAGTATMKSYDADTEKMILTLQWDDDLKPIFPEIKGFKTVSLNISKQEAKTLFGKQRTHYFHINLAYDSSKLMIFKIILNDQYTLSKHIKTKRQKNSRIMTKNNISAIQPLHHKDNENITLDTFLHKFYKVGEVNSASKVLPYYAYKVDRYFSMKNVTREDILKDKKQYYKKWVKRKYHLLHYEVLHTSYTDRAILYTVKTTINWKVTSRKGKVKYGTSTNIINLYHDHNGIVITSIK